MFFHAPALTCPSVIVTFFYNQMVRSDGRMPKCWELNWTVATVWLLFKPMVAVCPTTMAENLVLYRKGHSGSAPLKLLMATSAELLECVPGGTSYIWILYSSCIIFSGLLTLHFPRCASWELFPLVAVLVSFFDMLVWDIHPCNSWWAWLVLYCCLFIPLPWCICFFVTSALVTALPGRIRQCFSLHIRWCICLANCVLIVLRCWALWGECV